MFEGLDLFATIEFVADRKDSRADDAIWKVTKSKWVYVDVAQALRQRRVHIASKWTQLFIAPPLCIDEGLLTEGLELISESIEEASKTL